MHPRIYIIAFAIVIFLSVVESNGQLQQMDPKISVDFYNLAPIAKWEVPTNTATGESIVFIRGWCDLPSAQGLQMGTEGVAIYDKYVMFAEAFPIGMWASNGIVREDTWVDNIYRTNTPSMKYSVITLSSYINTNLASGETSGDSLMTTEIIAYTRPFKPDDPPTPVPSSIFKNMTNETNSKANITKTIQNMTEIMPNAAKTASNVTKVVSNTTKIM